MSTPSLTVVQATEIEMRRRAAEALITSKRHARIEKDKKEKNEKLKKRVKPAIEQFLNDLEQILSTRTNERAAIMLRLMLREYSTFHKCGNYFTDEKKEYVAFLESLLLPLGLPNLRVFDDRTGFYDYRDIYVTFNITFQDKVCTDIKLGADVQALIIKCKKLCITSKVDEIISVFARLKLDNMTKPVPEDLIHVSLLPYKNIPSIFFDIVQQAQARLTESGFTCIISSNDLVVRVRRTPHVTLAPTVYPATAAATRSSDVGTVVGGMYTVYDTVYGSSGSSPGRRFEYPGLADSIQRETVPARIIDWKYTLR